MLQIRIQIYPNLLKAEGPKWSLTLQTSRARKFVIQRQLKVDRAVLCQAAPGRSRRVPFGTNMTPAHVLQIFEPRQ